MEPRRKFQERFFVEVVCQNSKTLVKYASPPSSLIFILAGIHAIVWVCLFSTIILHLATSQTFGTEEMLKVAAKSSQRAFSRAEVLTLADLTGHVTVTPKQTLPFSTSGTGAEWATKS